MADDKADASTEPRDEEDAKAQAKLEAAAAAARQKKIDRLRRAIAPLEEAAANAHEQAGMGHVIAPTVTEAVAKAVHEMALAAKAVVSDT